MTSVDTIPAFLLAGVPILQPPHLEGDPALATEILPGPPPLLTIQQSGLPRKDHKKITPSYSYLPTSDPGTTYAGHMANPMVTASIAEVDGPRRKRARLEKSTPSSRAQRASTRHLAALETATPAEALASSSQALDFDPIGLPLDDDDVMILSRSNSIPNMDQIPAEEENTNTTTKRSRRDKGKGKEKEHVVRVKEEPGTVSISLLDPAQILSNEDHCSACRSLGSLVYCDGCPRAFHLICLNPPMEADELPQGDANWYCPACILRQSPPSKPPGTLKFMAPLFDNLQATLPAEYQLPTDIRTFFKDVGTSNRGGYVDSSEVKPPRLNRHGQLEDRDPYRLKDRNGDPVLCFKCGTSALPPSVAAAIPAMKRPRRASSRLSSTLSDTGRSIISCDYCHLHWHLDCVDPPLAFMPPWGKKWMCPNHVDQILKPKRRMPRGVQPIDVSKIGEVNNGNIEIVPAEEPALLPPAKMNVDEVLINGRRYRIPEKFITMDFWNKTRRREHVQDEDNSSSVSSPLTSLSSLEEVEDHGPPITRPGLFNMSELKAAFFLIGLQSKKPPQHQPLRHMENSALAVNGLAPQVAVGVPAPAEVKIKEEPDLHINGLLAAVPSTSSKRSSRSSTRAPRNTVTGTRAVRSSARVQAALQQSAIKQQAAAEHQNGGHVLPHNDQAAPTPLLSNGIAQDGEGMSHQTSEPGESGSTSGRPKRQRRKKQLPTSLSVGSISQNGSSNGQAGDSSNATPTSASVIDLPLPDKPVTVPDVSESAKKSISSSLKGRSHAKPITPAPAPEKPTAATPISTPANPEIFKPKEAVGSSTPSLKIRLPRLSSINSPIASTSGAATAADRETTKSSINSRNKPTRSRRIYSTSNDASISGAEGVTLSSA